jgi:hypothetical protein
MRYTKQTRKMETIELLRRETRNFIIKMQRIPAPVMINPNRLARAIKAAIRIINRMGLKLFRGISSSVDVSSFTFLDFRPWKTTMAPKKINIEARTRGKREGPGWPPSSSGNRKVIDQMKTPRAMKISPPI